MGVRGAERCLRCFCLLAGVEDEGGGYGGYGGYGDYGTYVYWLRGDARGVKQPR